MSNAYYQIRVEPANEIKNSISTGQFGAFQIKVMLQGDCNAPASVKSRFWLPNSSSAADQIVEFFCRSRIVLRHDARHARRALVKCSPTSDNITLDPHPCCNHYLRNPRWCPFHCLTRVSLSLNRVSRSFLHSNPSFNSLARYTVAILTHSVVASPMLCHHSPR